MNKKIVEFNQYKDFKDDPKIGRLEDFKFQGKKISEVIKTEAQKTVLKLAHKLVAERMDELEVSNTKISDDRITYYIPVGINNYQSEIDFVLIKESSEANVGTAIHEIIHANSAEWRYKNWDNITKDKDKRIRNVKSGFHTNHYKNGFEKDITSINFRQINEAITEKITRELVNKNIKEIEWVNSLFVGRLETALKNQRDRFEFKKIETQEKIKKIQKKAQDYILAAIEENKKNIADAKKEYDNGILNDEMFQQLKKIYKDNLDRRIEQIKSFSKINKGMVESFNDETTNKIRVDEIKEDYALKKDRVKSCAYTPYIEILDLMIEGLSYANSSTEEEYKIQKEFNWKNLQKAYFTGNVMYLRNFDKIYNDKVLRFFNNISQISSEEDVNKLIGYLKEKNENIKSDNFSPPKK
jgi:hypothetical protein